MKLLIVTDKKLEEIREYFSKNKTKGITMSYSDDIENLLTHFENNTTAFDKIVIVARIFSKWDNVMASEMFTRFAKVCTNTPTTDFTIIDSQAIFNAEYSMLLASSVNVNYITERIRKEDLVAVALGKPASIVSGSTTNDKEQKANKLTGLFKKSLFGKNNKSTVPSDNPTQFTDTEDIMQAEDVSLFQDVIELEINDESPIIENVPLITQVEHIAITEPEIPSKEDKFNTFENIKGKPSIKDISLFGNKVTKTKPVVEHKLAEPVHTDFVNILQRTANLLMVTGDRQSGVSTTVYNVANLCAKLGLQVCIVDLDYKRNIYSLFYPTVEHDVDLQFKYNLLYALRNPVEYAEAIRNVSEGIDVLACYANPTDIPEEIITVDHLQELFPILYNDYDLIIVDCPYEDLMRLGKLMFSLSKILYVSKISPTAVWNTANLLREDNFASKALYNSFINKTKILLNDCKPIGIGNLKISEDNFITSVSALAESEGLLDLTCAGSVPPLEDLSYEFSEYRKQPMIINEEVMSVYCKVLNEIWK